MCQWLFGMQFLKSSLIFPKLLQNSKAHDLVMQYVEKIESQSAFDKEMQTWQMMR